MLVILKKIALLAACYKLNGENGEISHRTFTDVLDLIDEGDLLIFNNTRVIPARMFGRKASGGKIEVLVERVLSEHHS